MDQINCPDIWTCDAKFQVDKTRLGFKYAKESRDACLTRAQTCKFNKHGGKRKNKSMKRRRSMSHKRR